MQEKTLLKIALITSITGIALLFILSVGMEKEEKPFQLLNEEDYSTISGKIAKVSAHENITFITLYESTPVNAVVIGKEYINLAEGDYVEMRGTVQNYNGKKEFVAEEIRKK